MNATKEWSDRKKFDSQKQIAGTSQSLTAATDIVIYPEFVFGDFADKALIQ